MSEEVGLVDPCSESAPAATSSNGIAVDVTTGESPGRGWTNGALPPTMFPMTRQGRIALYSNQRRWINAQSSWTRIGTGSEFDAKHTTSASGTTITRSLDDEAQTIRALIAQLCEKFYTFGWATGTGGGVSIRAGGPTENRPWRIFVAPSGIQKEDMIGDDIFELDMDMNVVTPPKTPDLRQSACTPLWYVVYRNRPAAKCVIHTHSMHAQMATLLDPTEQSSVLRITHLEMLKGVGGHAYDDILEIPIIDNRPTEDQLASQLESVIQKYPKCNGVLVRRHGVYVWGDSWEQAKTQCESFDYLFESACKMKSMGIDPGLVPRSGTYREVEEDEKEESPAKKRARMDENGSTHKSNAVGSVVSGFNAAGAVNNAADLTLSPIPLLPRDAKILLLDIEGCTTSISFVTDTLFPYALSNMDSYLDTLSLDELRNVSTSLINDLTKLDIDHDARKECDQVIQAVPPNTVDEMKVKKEVIVSCVKTMMKFDVKATGLKDLQGKMWKSGYHSGELKGHIYSDFFPTLQWCKSKGVSVNIYSSGSIGAQKLLFQHTSEGDLTSYLSSYFDTTSGSKKEHTSYQNIATSLGVQPSDIVFVSDAEAELVASQQAGIGHSVMSVRPGNAPLTDVGRKFPIVYSLMQLCGS